MPKIEFKCGKCGCPMESETENAGSIIQCHQCRHAVRIPESILKEGIHIGGYILEKLIGKGGMGEVWLAKHVSLGRKVALKILSLSNSKDPEFIARFQREMKIIARLDHPGIVAAYDAGGQDGVYYLATAYVNGSTLQQMIDSGRAFTEKEALTVIKRLSEALEYAWEKHRILHRDIKPSNIMIDDEGNVKLMDMGIAKTFDEDNSLTMTGTFVGTPYYMSPEQAKSDKGIDFRTDIYSLGATLYHMMTARVPFYATTTMGILAKLISDSPEIPERLEPTLSSECSSLIMKMMAKDRQVRYSSWRDVIRDIDTILDGGKPFRSLSDIPEGPGMVYRYRIPLIVLGLLVIVLLVGVINLISNRGNVQAGKDVSIPAEMEASPDEDGNRDVRLKRWQQFPMLADLRSAGLNLTRDEILDLMPIIREFHETVKGVKTKVTEGALTLPEATREIQNAKSKVLKKAGKILDKDKLKKLQGFLDLEKRRDLRRRSPSYNSAKEGAVGVVDDSE